MEIPPPGFGELGATTGQRKTLLREQIVLGVSGDRGTLVAPRGKTFCTPKRFF